MAGVAQKANRRLPEPSNSEITLGLAWNPPVCPKCNLTMVLKETTKFPWPDGSPRQFWSCRNWPHCDVLASVHRDGRLQATPADSKTRGWRDKAHQAFDLLWRGPDAPFTRKGAYAWLQRTTVKTPAQAHIGYFSIKECARLIVAIAEDFPEMVGEDSPVR